MLLRTKILVRFYSTPTFHKNFNHKNIKKNIIKKIQITNEDTKNIIKYNKNNSYKNMYSALPIKRINN